MSISANQIAVTMKLQGFFMNNPELVLDRMLDA
jgi:hypothetical protein